MARRTVIPDLTVGAIRAFADDVAGRKSMGRRCSGLRGRLEAVRTDGSDVIPDEIIDGVAEAFRLLHPGWREDWVLDVWKGESATGHPVFQVDIGYGEPVSVSAKHIGMDRGAFMREMRSKSYASALTRHGVSRTGMASAVVAYEAKYGVPAGTGRYGTWLTPEDAEHFADFCRERGATGGTRCSYIRADGTRCRAEVEPGYTMCRTHRLLTEAREAEDA